MNLAADLATPGPQPGRRAPDVDLFRLGADGRVERLRTSALFRGRRVVLFALPGAFTPMCSAAHVPRFDQLADGLAARGVEDVFCLSVNDPYVMAAWADTLKADRVRFLADSEGAFSGALNLLADRREAGLGVRSRRYALLLRDGVVEGAFVEDDAPRDRYALSDADTLLAYLDPEAPTLLSITMLARRGCPNCARAQQLLREHDLPFETIELDENVTLTSARAISGRSTVPQVFMQGRLIGGVDDLEAYLGRARPAESLATAS